MQGITGGLSGKMGSVVFRQRGGQTIASQYQPAVKNPNTEGQQDVRAAFKLMSQLAAIMSPGFGTMSVTKRKTKAKGTQRNAFFQLNYPLVEVAAGTDGVTAKIPMEQLQLTSSFRALPPLTSSEATSEVVHVVMDDIPDDVRSLRTILIGYRSLTDNSQQAVIEAITDFPVANNEVDSNITLPVNTPAGTRYTLLAYGLIPSASAVSRLDLDNIHTPADEQFISAVQLDAMVADGAMSETITVGVNLTVTTA